MNTHAEDAESEVNNYDEGRVPCIFVADVTASSWFIMRSFLQWRQPWSEGCYIFLLPPFCDPSYQSNGVLVTLERALLLRRHQHQQQTILTIRPKTLLNIKNAPLEMINGWNVLFGFEEAKCFNKVICKHYMCEISLVHADLHM